MMQVNYTSSSDNYQVELYNPKYYTTQQQQKLAKDSLSHIFQAASLSKVVFATIVLKMAEDGKIELDKPLYNYTNIDRFENKELAKKLTARMILSHRSGITDWCASPSSENWPTATITFKNAPDSCFGYSGEAFAFLQRAVEDINHEGIDETAKKVIFKPLNMNLTSYLWLPIYDTLAVDGHNKANENRGLEPDPRANVAYTLRTCANDYTKFLQGLISGKIITKENLERMTATPAVQAYGYADNHRECDSTIFWGLGIGIEVHPTMGKTLWHWGDNGTHKALFLLYPEKETSFIYMTNSNHGHEIIDNVTPLFFGENAIYAISKWIVGL